MKWFKSLFKKKDQSKKFKILVIEEDSDLLHISLGITDDRAEKLTRTILNELKENENLSFVIRDVVSTCKHENEVAFSMFVLQRALAKHEEISCFIDELTNL